MLTIVITSALVLGGQATGTPTTIRERYEQLAEEYSAKKQAFFQAYRAARTAADRQDVIKRLSPNHTSYADRFFALAKEDPKSPIASDAIYDALQIRRIRPTPETTEMLAMLRRDFATSPKMAYYLQQLSLRSFWPGIDSLFREVLKRNPDRTSRGHACLGLAEILSSQARLPKIMSDPKMAGQFEARYGKERLTEVLRADSEALLREATTLYERVLSDYADVRYFPALPEQKQTLGQRAERWLAAHRELEIGRVAPEIEGTDVEGKRFKLSDYRGKVVALVFWASWCGPCMAQIPHERELARSLEGKSFALLGVNCDYKIENARAVLAREKIGWPNWYDGSPRSGKIADRYHIQQIPAVFVLDAKGVIREKDVRGEALSKAVESLLKEQEAQGGSTIESE